MFDAYTCHLPNDLLDDLQDSEMDALEHDDTFEEFGA